MSFGKRIKSSKFFRELVQVIWTLINLVSSIENSRKYEFYMRKKKCRDKRGRIPLHSVRFYDFCIRYGLILFRITKLESLAYAENIRNTFFRPNCFDSFNLKWRQTIRLHSSNFYFSSLKSNVLSWSVLVAISMAIVSIFPSLSDACEHVDGILAIFTEKPWTFHCCDNVIMCNSFRPHWERAWREHQSMNGYE